MADRGGGALVTHFSVRTYYTFHYRAKTRKGVAPTASHYATLPFESMFTGLFLEEQAATAYNEMYGSAVAPTSPMVLKNNAERMMNVGIKAMRRDDMPRALRVATLVLLLRGDLGWHDGDDPPPAGSKDEQRERAFADLIRMTNSEAVWLFNVSQEARALEGLFIGPHALSKTAQNAEALAKHLQHFHFRVDDFMKDAVRRDFGLEPLRLMMSEVLVGAIRACERGKGVGQSPDGTPRVVGGGACAREGETLVHGGVSHAHAGGFADATEHGADASRRVWVEPHRRERESWPGRGRARGRRHRRGDREEKEAKAKESEGGGGQRGGE